MATEFFFLEHSSPYQQLDVLLLLSDDRAADRLAAVYLNFKGLWYSQKQYYIQKGLRILLNTSGILKNLGI